MFHPTVFDNLKVVLEGAVYDADFDGTIFVTGRNDQMDLATYHRFFQIEFCLAEDTGTEPENRVTTQVQLRTSLADIASEQLEQQITAQIGCTVCIHFLLKIRNVLHDTERITSYLNDIWGHRPHITQSVTARLDEHKLSWPPEWYENRITLDFHRKIDEGNIEDIQELLNHCIQSLYKLKQLT